MPKKTKPQGKLNPRIVVEGLLAGKKKKDIAVEAGSIAKRVNNRIDIVNNVRKSKEFKKEAEPFVKQMEKERQRALKAMEIKDLDKVEYDKLTTAIDKFTKNIQLLSGKPTEINKVNLEKEEQIQKALEDI